jgi:hypothetical protein
MTTRLPVKKIPQKKVKRFISLREMTGYVSKVTHDFSNAGNEYYKLNVRHTQRDGDETYTTWYDIIITSEALFEVCTLIQEGSLIHVKGQLKTKRGNKNETIFPDKLSIIQTDDTDDLDDQSF